MTIAEKAQEGSSSSRSVIDRPSLLVWVSFRFKCIFRQALCEQSKAFLSEDCTFWKAFDRKFL